MGKPIRVIEGSAQPHERFWTFRDQAQSESGEVELELFGPISEYSWWGDEITPALFKSDLQEKGAGKPVTLLVNSPGGEVIAASVIRSILQEYPGKVTADIVGLAASAATVLVTGADHIRMRESALFMIHDPSGLAWGTIDEIKAFLEVLKTVKDGIVDTYETKTKMERDKLAKLMTDETWMTAREAKEYGFIDEVVTSSVKKSGSTPIPAGFTNCLNSYMHVPESLKQLLSTPVNSNPVAPVQIEPSDEERRLRSKVQLLKGAK
jgi:ATP-dependent Clp protease protease subunit